MMQSRLKRFIAAILTVVNIGTMTGCTAKKDSDEDYQEALITIENLNREIAEYEEEIAQLTDAKEDLESENKTQKDEILELKKEVQSLQDKIEKLKDDQPKEPDKNEDQEPEKSENNDVDISESLVPFTDELASLIGLSEEDLLNDDIKANIEKLNAYLIECQKADGNLYYRRDQENNIIYFYTLVNYEWVQNSEQIVANVDFKDRSFYMGLFYPPTLNYTDFTNSITICLEDTNNTTLYSNYETYYTLIDDQTWNSLQFFNDANDNKFESFSYFDYGLKDDYVPYVYFSVNEDHQIKLYLTDVHDNSNEKVYDFNLSENDYQTVVNLFNFWKENNEKNNVLVYFKDTILEIIQKYGTEEEYNEINESFKAITDANIRLKSK